MDPELAELDRLLEDEEIFPRVKADIARRYPKIPTRTRAPAVSLTTTRAGSLAYGVGNDWWKFASVEALGSCRFLGTKYRNGV